jgi:hypothetical protein
MTSFDWLLENTCRVSPKAWPIRFYDDFEEEKKLHAKPIEIAKEGKVYSRGN